MDHIQILAVHKQRSVQFWWNRCLLFFRFYAFFSQIKFRFCPFQTLYCSERDLHKESTNCKWVCEMNDMIDEKNDFKDYIYVPLRATIGDFLRSNQFVLYFLIMIVYLIQSVSNYGYISLSRSWLIYPLHYHYTFDFIFVTLLHIYNHWNVINVLKPVP